MVESRKAGRAPALEAAMPVDRSRQAQPSDCAMLLLCMLLGGMGGAESGTSEVEWAGAAA